MLNHSRIVVKKKKKILCVQVGYFILYIVILDKGLGYNIIDAVVLIIRIRIPCMYTYCVCTYMVI